MQNNRYHRWIWQGRYLIFCIVATVIIVCFLRTQTRNLQETEIAPYQEDSVKRLKTLEEVSVGEVLALIEEKQVKEAEPLDINEEEDIDFKQYFASSIFMGDSMVEAFLAYDYLDTSSVVAKVGLRLGTVQEEVQTVINLSPQEVFLLFGANDLLIYKTADQYIEQYEALIQQLKQSLPKVKIYVISIFPIREDIASNTPELSLERVTAYNEALKKLSETAGYAFIDVGSYVTEEMYEPDGIHVKAKFYPIWMKVVKAYKEAESK